MSKIVSAYKVLAKGRQAPIGYGTWPEIGEWTERIEDARMCRAGYHLAPTPEDVVYWLKSGYEVYISEYREEDFVKADLNKILVKQARLVKQIDPPVISNFDMRDLLSKTDQALGNKFRSVRMRRALDIAARIVYGDTEDLSWTNVYYAHVGARRHLEDTATKFRSRDCSQQAYDLAMTVAEISAIVYNFFNNYGEEGRNIKNLYTHNVSRILKFYKRLNLDIEIEIEPLPEPYDEFDPA